MVSKNFEEDSLLLSLENIDNSWVLDFGTSFHATPHRGCFLDYVQGDFGLVYLVNNEPCQIFEKGKVNIKFQNGNHWLLHEVRNFPRLSKNLISARKLGDEGLLLLFMIKIGRFQKAPL